jgi:hypothetical protein
MGRERKRRNDSLVQGQIDLHHSGVDLRKYRGIMGYGLDDWGSRVPFPAAAGNFSFHQCVQNGSGAHSASYPMGTRGSFPGSKAAGA